MARFWVADTLPRLHILSKVTAMTDRPILDHSVKGSILGIFSYLLMRWHVDPALIALVTPLATAALGKLSMMYGGCNDVASFWARYE